MEANYMRVFFAVSLALLLLTTIANGEDVYVGEKRIESEWSVCIELPKPAYGDQSIITFHFAQPSSGSLYLDNRKAMVFESQTMAHYHTGTLAQGKHTFKVVVSSPAVLKRVQVYGSTLCE
jgi:hypothetical protein